LGKIIGLSILDLLLSTLAGIFIGVVGSLILKYSKFLNAISETLTIYCVAILGYYLIEALHYSGIITLFVSSLILGSYGWYNLSERSKVSIAMNL